MTARGYTAKKRLVRLRRFVSLPYRPGPARDGSRHFLRGFGELSARARDHALPLFVGFFVLSTGFDALAQITRPLRALPLAGSSAQLTLTTPAVAMPPPLSRPAITSRPAIASRPAPPAPVASASVGPVVHKGVPLSVTTAEPSPASRALRRKPRRAPIVVLKEHEVAKVLRLAGVPRSQVNAMTCTARFESSFNPRATNRNGNGTHDTGLFQINDLWLEACDVTRAALLDPVVNAKCARIILARQGLTAWMAYQERKRICGGYKVGDFERKRLMTIRRIVEAHEPAGDEG